MKKLKLLLLLSFVLGCATYAAGQEQWITGFVYVSETTEAVPFASVWLCNPQTGEQEYGTLSSLSGWYNFGNVETSRTYLLKVSAPGIQTRNGEVKITYDPTIKGNTTYHIPVARSSEAITLQPAEVYTSAKIAPDAQKIEDLYGNIPGVNYEDGYLIDENGATICLMFSGFIPDVGTYEWILGNLTAANVSLIEYYRLDHAEQPYYDGTLNFVLTNVNINFPTISKQLAPAPGWEL